MLTVERHEVLRPRFRAIDAHNHLGPSFGCDWARKSPSELSDVLDEIGIETVVNLDGGFADDFYPCGAFLADDAWHMIAATYDGAGNLNLYVDGVLDASTSISYNTTGQNNYLGRSNHVGFEAPFQGSMENVAIFPRALSGAEIAKLAGS